MNALTDSLNNQLLALGFDRQLADQWLEDARTVEPNLAFSPVWWRNEQELEQVGKEMCFGPFMLQAYQQARSRIESSCPQWWPFLAMADRLYRADDPAIRQRLLARPKPPVERWDTLADFASAMICLTGVKQMMDRHKAMRIDTQVTIDTLYDMVMRIELWHNAHGTLGIQDQGWLANHFRCDLFTLGRLQFAPGQFTLPFHVFEDDQNHTVTLLGAERTIRADGQFATADREAAINAPDNWTSTFVQTPDAWVGHPINAQRCVSRQPQSLARTQWRRVMAPSLKVLCVHIPQGAKLAPQACLNSFAMARSFFPRHLSFTYSGCSCSSWLMDPLLGRILDPSSNLVQFQNMFQLLPHPRGNDEQMFERVFGGPVDVAKAPRDTTLRRNILKAIQNGQRFRVAAAVRVEASESA